MIKTNVKPMMKLYIKKQLPIDYQKERFSNMTDFTSRQ